MILNRPIPEDDDVPDTERNLDIDKGPIKLEILKAIKHLKNSEAPGKDGLFPEIFKAADEERLLRVLMRLFN